jgi:hypothetical protein
MRFSAGFQKIFQDIRIYRICRINIFYPVHPAILLIKLLIGSMLFSVGYQIIVSGY